MCGLRVLLVLLHSLVIGAVFYPYPSSDLPPFNYDWTRVGLWAQSKPAHHTPYVHLQFNFTVTGSKHSTGRVIVMFFPARERYRADLALNYMIKRKECPDIQKVDVLDLASSPHLIYTQFPYNSFSIPPAPPPPSLLNLTFAPTLLTVYFDQTYLINETAAWYLYIFHCQDAVEGGAGDAEDSESDQFDSSETNLHLTGFSEWYNTIGYLDGIDYPMLIFSQVMIVLYGLCTIVYGGILLKNWQNIRYFQMLGICMFALGIGEHLFMYLAYQTVNVDGGKGDQGIYVYPTLRMLMAVTKGALQRTTLLLIFLGYKMAVSSLSKGVLIFMISITAGYAISDFSYQIVAIANIHSPLPSLTLQVILFPTQIFSCVFFGWYLISCYNVLVILRRFQENIKITKYLQTTMAVILAFLLNAFLVSAKGVATVVTAEDYWWAMWWTWDGASYFVSLVMLCICAWIWYPLPVHETNVDVTSNSSGGSGGSGSSDASGDNSNTNSNTNNSENATENDMPKQRPTNQSRHPLTLFEGISSYGLSRAMLDAEDQIRRRQELDNQAREEFRRQRMLHRDQQNQEGDNPGNEEQDLSSPSRSENESNPTNNQSAEDDKETELQAFRVDDGDDDDADVDAQSFLQFLVQEASTSSKNNDRDSSNLFYSSSSTDDVSKSLVKNNVSNE